MEVLVLESGVHCAPVHASLLVRSRSCVSCLLVSLHVCCKFYFALIRLSPFESNTRTDTHRPVSQQEEQKKRIRRKGKKRFPVMFSHLKRMKRKRAEEGEAADGRGNGLTRRQHAASSSHTQYTRCCWLRNRRKEHGSRMRNQLRLPLRNLMLASETKRSTTMKLQ